MIEWLKKVFSKILNPEIKLHNNNLGLVNANADIKADVRLADAMNMQFGNTYQDNRNVTIVQGITYEDMRICADTVANEKMALFKAELETKLLPEQLNKLKYDVGIIASYREAISISAMKSDEDFDKILSATLKDRIASDDTDYQNTCAQAISVMKNFTKNHFKLLALFYIFGSGHLKGFGSIEQFIEFYEQYISQLLDLPLDKIRDTGTSIIGNGCAVTYTFGSRVSDFFDKQIAEYIAKLSSKEAIREEEITQKNIIDRLDQIWTNSGLTSAFLTPIGKCIGHIYLKDLLNLDLGNLDTEDKLKSSSASVTYEDIGKIYKPV